MHIIRQKMRRPSRLADEKIFALAFVILFLVMALPRLFGGERVGAANWGDYDATFREVGLGYTEEYVDNPDRYYTHVVETYELMPMDLYRLLQLTPTSSLYYPVALARMFDTLTGQPFSTQQLAFIYLALIAIALYFLYKNAYRLWGTRALVLAVGIPLLLTGPGFMGWLNSLYDEGVIFTGVFLFLSALLAAATAERGRWTCLIPLYASGLFLSLVKEGLFLPVACFVLATLTVMTVYHRPRNQYLLRYILTSLVVLVVTGSLMFSYHLDSDVYTNTANRYDAVYGGLLTTSEDPAVEIAELGLPPETVADVGLSVYYGADAYAMDPNSPEAKQAIFEQISFPRMAAYYARNPGRLIDMGAALLESGGAFDTSRLMYVTPYADGASRTVGAGSVLNTLRASLTGGSPALYVGLSILYLAFAIAGFFRAKNRAVLALSAIAFLVPGMLAGLVLMQVLLYAFAYASHTLFPLKLMTDWLVLIGAQVLVLAAFRLGTFLRDEEAVPVTVSEETLTVMEGPPRRGLVVWPAVRRAGHTVWAWTQARIQGAPWRGAMAFGALAALIVYLVMFLPPHIGARNNGDYGRVMNDLGVDWKNPEDLEDSFYTNIEHYAWLENGNLSRLTVPEPGLSQVYLGAIMRQLPSFMGTQDYSTYWAAVVYAAVLLACLYVIFRSIFSLFSPRRALLINALLILLLLGTMHLGWINSLYGEGLEFLGLLMVTACGLSILTAPRGKCVGKFLLLTFCGQFLLAAKGQASLAAPGIILLLVVLGVYHITGTRRGATLLRATATVCLAALVVYTSVFAVAVFQDNQRRNAKQTEWQALFYGVLLLSDDPAQVLRDFDLDPRLLQDVGKHAYLPDEQYLYAPTSPEAQEMIFSKVGTMDRITYYLRHPGLLYRAMEHTAQAAREEMPDWFVYDGEWDTSAENPVDRFALWENIRPHVVPGHAATYLLFYLGTAAYAIAQLVRRRRDANRQRLVFYCFYLGLLLVSVLQFPISVIGNGLVDNVKQLYLQRLSFDLLLLFAVAEGMALLIRWVRRQEMKAVRNKGASGSEVTG